MRSGEKNDCCGRGRPARDETADMNDQLIIKLRDLSHVMRMQYEGRAGQKRILIILNEVGGMTQQELTRRLNVQPGTVSEVLSKLETAGLITRSPNDVDRRTTDIRLTQEGRAMAYEAMDNRKRRHREMFACLEAEEKEQLLVLLGKVYADWEVRYILKDEAK